MKHSRTTSYHDDDSGARQRPSAHRRNSSPPRHKDARRTSRVENDLQSASSVQTSGGSSALNSSILDEVVEQFKAEERKKEMASMADEAYRRGHADGKKVGGR